MTNKDPRLGTVSIVIRRPGSDTDYCGWCSLPINFTDKNGKTIFSSATGASVDPEDMHGGKILWMHMECNDVHYAWVEHYVLTQALRFKKIKLTRKHKNLLEVSLDRWEVKHEIWEHWRTKIREKTGL